MSIEPDRVGPFGPEYTRCVGDSLRALVKPRLDGASRMGIRIKYLPQGETPRNNSGSFGKTDGFGATLLLVS